MFPSCDERFSLNNVTGFKGRQLSPDCSAGLITDNRLVFSVVVPFSHEGNWSCVRKSFLYDIDGGRGEFSTSTTKHGNSLGSCSLRKLGRSCIS